MKSKPSPTAAIFSALVVCAGTAWVPLAKDEFKTQKPITVLRGVTHFDLPSDVELESVQIQGVPLFRSDRTITGAMQLVGRVDDGRWFLYQSLDSEANTGPMGGVIYFARTGSEAYVGLTTERPESGS